VLPLAKQLSVKIATAIEQQQDSHKLPENQ